MRLIRIGIVAAIVLTASGAVASEIDDAHKEALRERDTYWNCLAQEYQTVARDRTSTISAPDFTARIADVCPSERQSFRASLVGFLSLQFPDVDSGDHMTTANKAIALAQKDVVTAFLHHKESPK
jgi:hypothetical protein